MPEAQLVAPHIEIRESDSGPQAYIAAKGFKVRVLAELHLRAGLPVDEIVLDYGLAPAEIHAGLSYYYDHREEIDEQIAFLAKIEAELRPESSRPVGSLR